MKKRYYFAGQYFSGFMVFSFFYSWVFTENIVADLGCANRLSHRLGRQRNRITPQVKINWFPAYAGEVYLKPISFHYRDHGLVHGLEVQQIRLCRGRVEAV